MLKSNEGTREKLMKSFSLSRLLSLAFILLSFFWIGWLLVQEGGLLWSQLSESRWHWLIISLIIGAISIMPNSVIFFLMLNEQPDINLSLRYVSRLMFIGQLVRHLPGRFWGIVYQVNTSHERIPPLTTIKVNIDLMFILLTFNTLFPICIIVFYYLNLLAALTLFFLGSTFIAFALRLNWIIIPVNLFQRCFPHRFTNSLEKYRSAQCVAYSWRSICKFFFILLISWFLYLLAWKTFPIIFPFFGDLNMVLLCAIYSIAWVIGFLSMFTPAGLGIREATFIFFAGNLMEPSNMAFMALFTRVWLLTTDFILFIVVLIFRGKYEESYSQNG